MDASGASTSGESHDRCDDDQTTPRVQPEPGAGGPGRQQHGSPPRWRRRGLPRLAEPAGDTLSFTGPTGYGFSLRGNWVKTVSGSTVDLHGPGTLYLRTPFLAQTAGEIALQVAAGQTFRVTTHAAGFAQLGELTGVSGHFGLSLAPVADRGQAGVRARRVERRPGRRVDDQDGGPDPARLPGLRQARHRPAPGRGAVPGLRAGRQGEDDVRRGERDQRQPVEGGPDRRPGRPVPVRRLQAVRGGRVAQRPHPVPRHGRPDGRGRARPTAATSLYGQVYAAGTYPWPGCRST